MRSEIAKNTENAPFVRTAAVGWRRLFLSALLVGASACFLAGPSQAQSLSRAQAILQNRGLQIQAMVVPDHNAPNLSLSRFDQSNFTAVNLNTFDRTVNLSKYLGSAPGQVPAGMWLNNGPNTLNAQELSYLPNLVSLQFHDELDISLPGVVQESKQVLESWRSLYPNTIGYLNHISGNTDAQFQSYLSVVEPDMLMFATYPFDGNVAGGSPTNLYVDLQRFRKLGLGGHDSTGAQPIPYALYLQTFTWDVLNDHHPSASEMRLNQFSAWAFGYTFATSFIYTDVPNESSFQATLFNGAGDASPRQPAFNDMAETNRQSVNLGDALVRLQSTNVGMLMGQHQTGIGSPAVNNTLPTGILSWSSATDSDPYLMAINAQNVGGANGGLRGDVVVGNFRPMQGAADPYFMIVNGLSSATGTVGAAAQSIDLNFDFGTSGINSLLRLSRTTGLVESIPLTHLGGSQYSLSLTLDGGTGDLFKYDNGLQFVGKSQIHFGYAVSTSSNVVFVGQNGSSILSVQQTAASDVVGLSNGNVVAQISSDTFRIYNGQGIAVGTHQLAGMGTFNSAVPVGSGGYAAASNSHVVFFGADGQTVRGTRNDAVQMMTSLTNGNAVARIAGTDIWRLYDSAGNVLTSRVLDNSGQFQRAAALGGGGYAAVTNSRIIFMAADGIAVRSVVTDVVASLTSLTNGNVVGQLSGTDFWRVYDSIGNILATRLLDNVGDFQGAVAAGEGGYAAIGETAIVFVAADGQTVIRTQPDALEFVTPLANGRVAGRLLGTDSWRLYDSDGSILATKLLNNLGSFTGAAATGFAVPDVPGDYNRDGLVNVDDYGVWQSTFGSTTLLGADGNGDGAVDASDYVVWRDNMGASGAGAASVAISQPLDIDSENLESSLAVPEPNSALLLFLGMLLVGHRSLSRVRRAAAALAFVGLPTIAVHAEPLSRGHEILQRYGLQLHAMVVPDAKAGPLNHERFVQSGFSGLSLNSFNRSLDLESTVGIPADCNLSLWLNDGPPLLNTREQAILSQLVLLQLHDEQDVAVPEVLDEAKAVLANWRELYPHAISYLNQNGIRHTMGELQSYISYVQPDAVMFDVYPFDGQNDRRRLADFYLALARYRQLGLGGHDGTGREPIPAGLYLQTFTSEELRGHLPSGSEMRLNQFAAWAFGFKFATAFLYVDVPNESNMDPSLFDGPSDARPRAAALADISETNRQSLALGPALVRLKSTDVRMIMGERPGEAGKAVKNELPREVQAWTAGAGGDAFIRSFSVTNVSSANSGLAGDAIVGFFEPLAGADDGYFMIVNGLIAPELTAENCLQRIKIEFDFANSGITRLVRLSRQTGQVEQVTLEHDGANRYHCEIEYDGGTGDLYKYDNGHEFVGVDDLDL